MAYISTDCPKSQPPSQGLTQDSIETKGISGSPPLLAHDTFPAMFHSRPPGGGGSRLLAAPWVTRYCYLLRPLLTFTLEPQMTRGLLVALERQAGSDWLASWLWGPLLACYTT